ncbi:MAG TPA: class I SAM-dependent methyltransferase [Solirubrobacteraceae bacterium]|nr:class I SAM-dependent methyltransferase [Solirubrobacteraceae bacterium]
MTVHDSASRGFQLGADAYERGRPGYPQDAIDWLRAQLDLTPGRTVLDVGAGTGKLTRQLVATGATVLAVEPVPGMRAVLERVVPEATAMEGTAEALPVGDGAVDAVTVGQAFHWFDVPITLAEFHRVLRPTPAGRFGLIWNRRRMDQPLHREISAIIEPYHGDTPRHLHGAWREPVETSELFTKVEELEVPSEQVVDVDGVVDRVGSTSFIAALPDSDREAVLGRVRALAERHPAPLRLEYVTEAYVYERR